MERYYKSKCWLSHVKRIWYSVSENFPSDNIFSPSISNKYSQSTTTRESTLIQKKTFAKIYDNLQSKCGRWHVKKISYSDSAEICSISEFLSYDILSGWSLMLILSGWSCLVDKKNMSRPIVDVLGTLQVINDSLEMVFFLWLSGPDILSKW